MLNPTKKGRNCIVRCSFCQENDYDDGSNQPTLLCWGWRARNFRKRDERKNPLDQNVNGKEVKRVIYFWSQEEMSEDKRQQQQEQQSMLLILWSFTRFQPFFRNASRLPTDGKLWSFACFPVHFSIVGSQRNVNDTQCVIKRRELERARRDDTSLNVQQVAGWLKLSAMRWIFVLSVSCYMFRYRQYAPHQLFPLMHRVAKLCWLFREMFQHAHKNQHNQSKEKKQKTIKNRLNGKHKILI